MLADDTFAVPMVERDPGAVDDMDPNSSPPDPSPDAQAEKGDGTGNEDGHDLRVPVVVQHTRRGDRHARHMPDENHRPDANGRPLSARRTLHVLPRNRQKVTKSSDIHEAGDVASVPTSASCTEQGQRDSVAA